MIKSLFLMETHVLYGQELKKKKFLNYRLEKFTSKIKIPEQVFLVNETELKNLSVVSSM